MNDVASSHAHEKGLDMRHMGFKWAKATAVALAMSVALSGCTIPFINVEVPIDLPELPFELPSLPEIDLSNLDIKPIKLPIGVTTSVDEARQDVLAGKSATLSDDALVAPGYLSVGVKLASSSAPMCVAGEGGSLFGLDVDLGAAMASEMGLKVRYVPVVDESSLGKDCDVIMNSHSDNPDSIAIAGTYVESASSFFTKGEPTVVSATDLGGKSVGLQSGSASEAVLNETGLKMSQKSYSTLNEAFEALAAGEVDYVLCEAYPGAYLAALHTGISFAGALETPVTSGIAMLPSNTELVAAVQAAFDGVSANGIYGVVRTRWVGNMPVLTSDSVIQNIPEGKKSSTNSDTTADQSGETVDATGSDDEGDGSDAGSNAITSL